MEITLTFISLHFHSFAMANFLSQSHRSVKSRLWEQPEGSVVHTDLPQMGTEF